MSEFLAVLGGFATAVEPGQSLLDNPALGQQNETRAAIGALDDLRLQMRQDRLASGVELLSLIAGVSEQRLQERIHPENRRQQQEAAIAILDIGVWTMACVSKTLDRAKPLLMNQIFLDQL